MLLFASACWRALSPLHPSPPSSSLGLLALQAAAKQEIPYSQLEGFLRQHNLLPPEQAQQAQQPGVDGLNKMDAKQEGRAGQ